MVSQFEAEIKFSAPNWLSDTTFMIYRSIFSIKKSLLILHSLSSSVTWQMAASQNGVVCHVDTWQIEPQLTWSCLAFSSMTIILSCTDLNTEYMEMGFRGAGGMGSTSRTKRMRTSFKHHQLRTMKSYFAINHNPDAKDLKQLSQKTGLPKRVLQVIWLFLNFSS